MKKNEEKKTEITVEEVIDFIIKNSDNTKIIDKINKITFPFTSKFRDYQEKKEEKQERRLPF